MAANGGLVEYLCAQGLSPRTVREYARQVAHASGWFAAADTDLSRVTAIDVAAYMETRPRTWASRNLTRAALRHYWAFVGRRDPPLAAIRVPPKPQMVCRAVEPDDATLLAKAARTRGDAKGLATALGLYLALRREEIASLRWDAFGGSWVTVVGKGEQQATIPVHTAVTDLLAAYPHDSAWLFPGRGARSHVAPATIWAWILAVADEAGVGRVTPHQLRHTSLATANDNLGDLRAVSTFARHRRLQTTMGYTRTTAKKLAEVVEALDY